jgi:hypothetical protein
MIDFESKEVDRADFRGETITSFIDGSQIRYFSSKSRKALLIQSVLSIVTIIMLVLGIVVGIYIIRYAIAHDVGDSNAQNIASICNAVQIQVVNYIYSIAANGLSERENHRTDTQVHFLPHPSPVPHLTEDYLLLVCLMLYYMTG